MAEAEVEASISSRFFCHKCSTEITPLPEYLCPRCNSGFIEILEAPPDSDSDSSTDMDFDFLELFSGSSGSSQNNTESSPSGGASSSGPRRSQRFRSTLNPRHGRRRFGHDRQQALAPILQEVIMQMTSSILGNGVGGADLGIFADGIELPGGVLYTSSANLASNPGDYAWGRGGLDAIITQLMNQLDGTGPPPLPQDKINQIPIIKISTEQCEKNIQCTVCMEDFKLDEPVRKLNCEHCYHEDCIIPWLQLHATCPVCRKTLVEESDRVRLNQFMPSDLSDSSGSFSFGPETTPERRSNRSFMEEDLD